MTENQAHSSESSRLDAATAARLRKLADAPVDMAAFEARLSAAINQQPTSIGGMARVQFLRRSLAAAAGIALAAVVIFSVIGRSASTAHAEILDLTQVHAQLLDGQSAEPHVSTVSQANAIIADRATLPERALQTHVRSCCLRDVEGALRTAVLLEQDGLRISIVVADGGNFATPMGDTVTRDGHAYHIHKMGDLTMVMSRRQDRWLCVMADAPREALLAVATQIRF
jgi:hypothetical protein